MRSIKSLGKYIKRLDLEWMRSDINFVNNYSEKSYKGAKIFEFLEEATRDE